MSSLLYSDNILTGAAVENNIVQRVRDSLLRARASNLLINGLYAGAATLTQAAAVDGTTTRSVDPAGQRDRFLYKYGKPNTTANTAYSTSIQDLSGAQIYEDAIEFVTDSATCTLKFRRQGSNGFRLAINGQYVSSASLIAWSTAVATYNYLVIAGLTGTNTIRIEWDVNAIFEHCYVTPLASVWSPPMDIVAAVVGDSFTASSGATRAIDGFPYKLQILTGFDVLFPLGYSGTGYTASLGGNSFTGTTTEGSATVLVSNTASLSVGRSILGSGGGAESAYIPRHAKIVSIVANTSITLDVPATASAVGATFHAAYPALTPTDFWNRSTGQTRLAWDFSRMPRNPDVIFFMLGLNDDVNATGYANIVRETFALARQLCPKALIVNLGTPHTPANGGNSGAPNYVSSFSKNSENTVRNIVAAFNDPMMISIRNCTDPNAGIGESWFWGDGKAGATNGHGNTDVFSSSDGTHPTTAGHLFLAQKIVAGLASALPQVR